MEFIQSSRIYEFSNKSLYQKLIKSKIWAFLQRQLSDENISEHTKDSIILYHLPEYLPLNRRAKNHKKELFRKQPIIFIPESEFCLFFLKIKKINNF